MYKILNIVGARPNFMKIAPLMSAMEKSSLIEPVLIHTGQHYDEKMSKLFFEELEIPKPFVNLEVGSDSQAKQVAKIMERFDDVCQELKPNAILVVGDVNSTMACSIVAAKLGIKIIHMEAGLRSYDRRMPEEINRIVTDALADLLLTPSDDGTENLMKEGISPDKVHLVGNIMIDTLMHFLPKSQHSEILNSLGISPKDYVAVTLHRPSTVDDEVNLKSVLETLSTIQKDIKIVFPIHPRTRKNITHYGLNDLVENSPDLILTEPLGYLDFQKLMSNSKFVITDSGGVQEETTALKIPCITVRENTERPVTIWEGSNEIVGFDMEKLLFFANKAFSGNWKESKIPKYWDGKTAERVVDEIENYFGLK
ncbi:MAG: UDP-N-acetylglucosamine 2-epimerase (non-hydrolyzing) [Candidatus Kapabacteria bacterium]|nr:UDP-N-acetylglucosamine 2-epimerase (non-hydrolyzing) [Ignavibacteriota bacterium]MCW5884609.1 UDP-N-acetylglucosamine 2-epimerase (non-hydrolyzing) [Candidatus Kapabacteria bacterium]